MRKNCAIRRIILLVVLIPLLLLSILSIILILVLVNRGRKNAQVYQYDYLDYNPLTNKTTRGVAWMKRKLKKNEVFHYDSFSGRTVSISNLEAPIMYECRGKCQCLIVEGPDPLGWHRRSSLVDGNGNSRRFSTIPVGAMQILSTVVLAIFAINHYEAKKFAIESFRTKCKEEWKNDCKGQAEIVTKIDYCARVDTGEDMVQMDRDIEFTCNGHCETNDFLRKEDVIEEANKYDCSSQGIEQTFRTSYKKKIGDAYDIFMRKYLRPYCREASRVTYKYVYEIMGEKRVYPMTMYFCQGGNMGIRGQRYSNIECTQLKS